MSDYPVKLISAWERR